MSGWTSRKSVAERIEATRIPDAVACPGSHKPLVEGVCGACGMLVGVHYPNGQTHKHKAPQWLRERRDDRD